MDDQPWTVQLPVEMIVRHANTRTALCAGPSRAQRVGMALVTGVVFAAPGAAVLVAILWGAR